MFHRLTSLILIVTFTLTSAVTPSSAQALPLGGNLPVRQAGLESSVGSTQLPVFNGIKIYPQEPFRFDFLVDEHNSPQPSLYKKRGSNQLEEGNPLSFSKEGARGSYSQSSQGEYLKLIKYFMASLTVPEGDLWVNLSPYEPDRIVPQALGQTEMGRDLLAQDYILKQLTASLMSPEGESGKKFWERVYEKIYEQNIPSPLWGGLGRGNSSTEHPHPASPIEGEESSVDDLIESFNKVWIVPNEVEVYQNGDVAYITKATLKVMLESDYLAEQESQSHRVAESQKDFSSNSSKSPSPDVIPAKAGIHFNNENGSRRPTEVPDMRGVKARDDSFDVKDIIRTTIIPLIEDEVNHGESFANLRQIFHSMILAKWYKQHFKNSVLGQNYTDRNITPGINLSDADQQKESIYNAYVQAFKTGAADVIKEEYDPVTQTVIPRKYFTGGVGLTFNEVIPVAQAMLNPATPGEVVSVNFAMMQDQSSVEYETAVSSGIMIFDWFGTLSEIDGLFFPAIFQFSSGEISSIEFVKDNLDWKHIFSIFIEHGLGFQISPTGLELVDHVVDRLEEVHDFLGDDFAKVSGIVQHAVDSERMVPVSSFQMAAQAGFIQTHILDQLKEAKKKSPDLKVYIVSSELDVDEVKEALAQNGYGDIFDDIFAGKKSDIFKTILEGKDLKAAVAIGDTFDDELKVAQDMGVPAFGVNKFWNDGLRPEERQNQEQKAQSKNVIAVVRDINDLRIVSRDATTVDIQIPVANEQNKDLVMKSLGNDINQAMMQKTQLDTSDEQLNQRFADEAGERIFIDGPRKSYFYQLKEFPWWKQITENDRLQIKKVLSKHDLEAHQYVNAPMVFIKLEKPIVLNNGWNEPIEYIQFKRVSFDGRQKMVGHTGGGYSDLSPNIDSEGRIVVRDSSFDVQGGIILRNAVREFLVTLDIKRRMKDHPYFRVKTPLAVGEFVNVSKFNDQKLGFVMLGMTKNQLVRGVLSDHRSVRNAIMFDHKEASEVFRSIGWMRRAFHDAGYFGGITHIGNVTLPYADMDSLPTLHDLDHAKVAAWEKYSEAQKVALRFIDIARFFGTMQNVQGNDDVMMHAGLKSFLEGYFGTGENYDGVAAEFMDVLRYLFKGSDAPVIQSHLKIVPLIQKAITERTSGKAYSAMKVDFGQRSKSRIAADRIQTILQDSLPDVYRYFFQANMNIVLILMDLYAKYQVASSREKAIADMIQQYFELGMFNIKRENPLSPVTQLEQSTAQTVAEHFLRILNFMIRTADQPDSIVKALDVLRTDPDGIIYAQISGKKSNRAMMQKDRQDRMYLKAWLEEFTRFYQLIPASEQNIKRFLKSPGRILDKVYWLREKQKNGMTDVNQMLEDFLKQSPVVTEYVPQKVLEHPSVLVTKKKLNPTLFFNSLIVLENWMIFGKDDQGNFSPSSFSSRKLQQNLELLKFAIALDQRNTRILKKIMDYRGSLEDKKRFLLFVHYLIEDVNGLDDLLGRFQASQMSIDALMVRLMVENFFSEDEVKQKVFSANHLSKMRLDRLRKLSSNMLKEVAPAAQDVFLDVQTLIDTFYQEPLVNGKAGNFVFDGRERLMPKLGKSFYTVALNKVESSLSTQERQEFVEFCLRLKLGLDERLMKEILLHSGTLQDKERFALIYRYYMSQQELLGDEWSVERKMLLLYLVDTFSSSKYSTDHVILKFLLHLYTPDENQFYPSLFDVSEGWDKYDELSDAVQLALQKLFFEQQSGEMRRAWLDIFRTLPDGAAGELLLPQPVAAEKEQAKKEPDIADDLPVNAYADIPKFLFATPKYLILDLDGTVTGRGWIGAKTHCQKNQFFAKEFGEQGLDWQVIFRGLTQEGKQVAYQTEMNAIGLYSQWRDHIDEVKGYFSDADWEKIMGVLEAGENPRVVTYDNFQELVRYGVIKAEKLYQIREAKKRNPDLKAFLVTGGTFGHDFVRLLEQNGWGGIFDQVVGSGDKRKTFQDILEEYQLKPEDGFAMGDSKESELRAAKNLGIPRAGVNFFWGGSDQRKNSLSGSNSRIRIDSIDPFLLDFDVMDIRSMADGRFGIFVPQLNAANSSYVTPTIEKTDDYAHSGVSVPKITANFLSTALAQEILDGSGMIQRFWLNEKDFENGLKVITVQLPNKTDVEYADGRIFQAMFEASINKMRKVDLVYRVDEAGEIKLLGMFPNVLHGLLVLSEFKDKKFYYVDLTRFYTPAQNDDQGSWSRLLQETKKDRELLQWYISEYFKDRSADLTQNVHEMSEKYSDLRQLVQLLTGDAALADQMEAVDRDGQVFYRIKADHAMLQTSSAVPTPVADSPSVDYDSIIKYGRPVTQGEMDQWQAPMVNFVVNSSHFPLLDDALHAKAENFDDNPFLPDVRNTGGLTQEEVDRIVEMYSDYEGAGKIPSIVFKVFFSVYRENWYRAHADQLFDLKRLGELKLAQTSMKRPVITTRLPAKLVEAQLSAVGFDAVFEVVQDSAMMGNGDIDSGDETLNEQLAGQLGRNIQLEGQRSVDLYLSREFAWWDQISSDDRQKIKRALFFNDKKASDFKLARTTLITLETPVINDWGEEIRYIQLKRVGFDADQPWTAHEGGGFIPNRYDADSDGRITVTPNQKDPQGGMLLRDAVNEFLVTSRIKEQLKGRNLFRVKTPLGIGVFSGVNEFEGKRLGVVVLGLTQSQKQRWIVSSLKGYKYSVPFDVGEVIETFRVTGWMLRVYHDLGYFRLFMHPGNMSVPYQDIDPVPSSHDLDGVTVAEWRAYPEIQKQALRLADIAYVFRLAHRDSTWGEEAKVDFVRAFLQGYFGKEADIEHVMRETHSVRNLLEGTLSVPVTDTGLAIMPLIQQAMKEGDSGSAYRDMSVKLTRRSQARLLTDRMEGIIQKEFPEFFEYTQEFRINPILIIYKVIAYYLTYRDMTLALHHFFEENYDDLMDHLSQPGTYENPSESAKEAMRFLTLEFNKIIYFALQTQMLPDSLIQTIRDLTPYVQRKDSAMMHQSALVVSAFCGAASELLDKGGIDLNNLNMKTSGQAAPIQMPSGPAMMNMKINGLVPRIIHVGAMNVGQFLGLNPVSADRSASDHVLHETAAIRQEV